MAKNRNPGDFDRIIAERQERLKELACLNQTTQILKEGKALHETLTKITHILPVAWQYPEMCVARIVFKRSWYISRNFRETDWCMSQDFQTLNGDRGVIEVFYLQKYENLDEGPFLKEERDLINNLASILVNYINSLEAEKILQKSRRQIQESTDIQELEPPPNRNRQLLQKFLKKQNINKDIFHDLMPYRVREILLVATLYDAYSVEREGRFSDSILGEYQQLSLTYMPRLTGVSSYEEAIEQLNFKHFDLVIVMIGSDRVTPLEIGKRVKHSFPYLPIYALLNNDRDIFHFKKSTGYVEIIDRIFVWNGDSKIFFAMIKQLEDQVNVENDTNIGMVKVILLVEDSEKYYSRYLPLLYSNVLKQTRRIIDDVSSDDLFKVLRLRARPKILLATNYERAIEIFERYKEDLLCLITDVKFERNGRLDEEAGFRLVKHVRQQVSLPIVIQSSDDLNSHRAFQLKAVYINKNSDTLIQDIDGFIRHHLGFGNFIYKDSAGKTIAVAKSLKEFESNIDTIPDESLVYHGKRNHFSLWLMARGEIKIARMIHSAKVSDFKTIPEFRNYLKFVISKYRNEANTGRVINFEDNAILDETNIVSLAQGALGGKGRGLAFINTLIYNLDFSKILPGLLIRTPITTIIGTAEFDLFMEKNQLYGIIHTSKDYMEIKQHFLNADLSLGLEKKLRTLLKLIRKPIAFRSSSLLEDSTAEPFSGIFATYLLPNNHPDFNTRLKQATDAIKLVFSSIYSDHAKSYFKAINFRIEDEKMAVVIQEVVGNQFGDCYYPHISGTAQSYNYYPVARMKPEDGFAVAALGLGQYVVEGEKAYRFSPKHPKLEVHTPADLIKSSQVSFYAIDMTPGEIDFLEKDQEATLVRKDILEAERHGTIKHCASVYDKENDRIVAGLDIAGPRIINFENILKHKYIPLAQAINFSLNVVKEALGAPVEIEFAVDLEKDRNGKASFYLLQIKPLVGSTEDFEINTGLLSRDKIILFAEKSMGNGRIDDIRDVVFIKPDQFDHTLSREIIPELETVNEEMVNQDKKYILIGPGRWGTRDRFIGIPVAWPQISNAKIIVEMSLPEFPLDASLGSHFFHNVISMNVGYLSIQNSSATDFIDWNILNLQETVSENKYVKHVRFEKSLNIVMDGKKRISVITWENPVSLQDKR